MSSSNSVNCGSSAFLITGSSIASISLKYFLTICSRSQMQRITFQHLNMITFFFSLKVGETISVWIRWISELKVALNSTLFELHASAKSVLLRRDYLNTLSTTSKNFSYPQVGTILTISTTSSSRKPWMYFLELALLMM